MSGIVLEGMDNTGKSTLAKKLSALLAMPVYTSGPPPRDIDHAFSCIKEQSDMFNNRVIVDRVTCISDKVYQDNRFYSLYDSGLAKLAQSDAVVIYCRPPRRTIVDFSGHVEKPYDSEEHLKKLTKNMHVFIDRYDEFFNAYPHIRYDWTDPDIPVENLARELLKCQYIYGYKGDLYEKLKNASNISSF